MTTPQQPPARPDIDPLTQDMYDEGFDGIHIAEVTIACGIAALIVVQNGRANDPAAFPGYPALDAPHTAARIITAQLLNAGWRPPDRQALDVPDDPQTV